MKKFTSIALSVLAVAAMTSCAKANADSRPDNIARETRSVSVTNFSGVDVSSGIDVIYSQSDRLGAVVEARADVLPYVKVEQKGEMLNIFFDRNAVNTRHTGRVVVSLSAPMLNTYMVSSGAEVKVKGNLELGNRKCSVTVSSGAEADFGTVTGPEFYINASSGGEVEVDNLSVTKVQADASSGASVDISGKVTNAVLTASSGASIDAKELMADAGSANASSSGSIKCNVSGKFSSSTSSAGVVNNYGR